MQIEDSDTGFLQMIHNPIQLLDCNNEKKSSLPKLSGAKESSFPPARIP